MPEHGNRDSGSVKNEVSGGGAPCWKIVLVRHVSFSSDAVLRPMRDGAGSHVRRRSPQAPVLFDHNGMSVRFLNGDAQRLVRAALHHER